MKYPVQGFLTFDSNDSIILLLLLVSFLWVTVYSLLLSSPFNLASPEDSCQVQRTTKALVVRVQSYCGYENSRARGEVGGQEDAPALLEQLPGLPRRLPIQHECVTAKEKILVTELFLEWKR